MITIHRTKEKSTKMLFVSAPKIIFHYWCTNLFLLTVKENISALINVYLKFVYIKTLGTGEAGKSTFLQSLQISYGDGISDDEKRKKIKLVHQNIVLGKRLINIP